MRLEVAEITPEVAADRVINQSVNYNLLLHEYYLTDKAGHDQDPGRVDRILTSYNRFLNRVIRERPDNITLVLSSDHGNVEDLSVKTHTFNEVPLFVLGPGARHFGEAASIQDVTPGIIKTLEQE